MSRRRLKGTPWELGGCRADEDDYVIWILFIVVTFVALFFLMALANSKARVEDIVETIRVLIRYLFVVGFPVILTLVIVVIVKFLYVFIELVRDIVKISNEGRGVSCRGGEEEEEEEEDDDDE